MAISNEYDCHFRMLCNSSLIQRDGSGELTSIEFKRANVSIVVATVQQTKNIRTNGCILNDINLMTNSDDNTILYFHFVGRCDYLAQLFVHEGAYDCQKHKALVTPASMIQLDFFRSSLKTIVVWESHSIKLYNKFRLARMQREHMYYSANVSTSTSPPYYQKTFKEMQEPTTKMRTL